MPEDRQEPYLEMPKRDVVSIRLAPLEGLGFEDSLNLVKFEEHVGDQVCSSLNRYLQSAPGSGVVTVGALATINQSTLSVVFSPETQEALAKGILKLGKRGNQTIAHAVNQSGHVKEIGQVVRTGASGATLVASAATVVVQAAYMITSADISKQLTAVNKSLSLMLQYRETDQMARLARIFYDIQSLTGTSGPSRGSAAYLDRARPLHNELVELRKVWIGELTAELKNVKATHNRGFLMRLGTRNSTIQKENKRALHTAAVKFQMMDYTLRLDRVLMVDLADWNIIHQSLPHEIKEAEQAVVALVVSAKNLDSDIAVVKWKRFGEQLCRHLQGFNPSSAMAPENRFEGIFELSKSEQLAAIVYDAAFSSDGQDEIIAAPSQDHAKEITKTK